MRFGRSACRALAAAGLVAALAGCSTVPVDRAIGVAEAGRAYAEAMKKVNRLALDRSIEFTANLLPSLPRTEAVLNETTEAMRKRTALFAGMNDYLDGLADYFRALEALARGEESDGAVRSLGQAADALRAAPVELDLPAQRKRALTGLAGQIARQGHAAAIERVLVRDADVVAQALALSERLLDEEIRWIEVRESAERKRNYAQNIHQPFVAGGTLGAGWKRAWSAELRSPPVVALLTEARGASVQMQKAWTNVLRAQFSYAEIHTALRNVRESIEALSALDRVN